MRQCAWKKEASGEKRGQVWGNAIVLATKKPKTATEKPRTMMLCRNTKIPRSRSDTQATFPPANTTVRADFGTEFWWTEFCVDTAVALAVRPHDIALLAPDATVPLLICALCMYTVLVHAHASTHKQTLLASTHHHPAINFLDEPPQREFARYVVKWDSAAPIGYLWLSLDSARRNFHCTCY